MASNASRMEVSVGSMMAESNPAAKARVRNVLLIKWRLGSPNETLLSPMVMWARGNSSCMRLMTSRVVFPAAISVAMDNTRVRSEKWFTLPYKTGKGTMHISKRNLELYVYPVIGKHQIDQIRRKHLKA